MLAMLGAYHWEHPILFPFVCKPRLSCVLTEVLSKAESLCAGIFTLDHKSPWIDSDCWECHNYSWEKMTSKSEGCNLVVEHLCSTHRNLSLTHSTPPSHIVLWWVGITGHGHSLREEQLPGGISELVFRVPLSWGMCHLEGGAFFTHSPQWMVRWIY